LKSWLSPKYASSRESEAARCQPIATNRQADEHRTIVLDREVVLVQVVQVKHLAALGQRAARQEPEPADRRAEVDADVQSRNAASVEYRNRDVTSVARKEAMVRHAANEPRSARRLGEID
jgi:hypothetical protein